MADISNRTLAILMVAAILVSLGGLFISLDRLAKLQVGAPPAITGFAGTGTGRANVSIQSILSITLADDSRIDFGACTVNPGNDIILESNWTCSGDAANCDTMNTTVGNGGCARVAGMGLAPDNITIRNDGNEFANVTFTSLNTSSDIFLDITDNDRLFAYRTINYSTTRGACGLNAWNQAVRGPLLSVNYTENANWTAITSNSLKYTACTNLTYGGYDGFKALGGTPSDAKIQFQIRMVVPTAEPAGQRNTTLTFTASNPS